MFIIMKCKLTPQWNITTYLPKWLKLNILITSDFNKDMEQPDFLTFLVAVHNGTTTVGGQFWQVPIKINMYLSDHPTNSIKEIKEYVNTKTFTWMFTVILFLRAKNGNPTKRLSSGQQTDRTMCINTVP